MWGLEIDHTSGVHYKIEQSKNNHFMYWTSKGPTYKHKCVGAPVGSAARGAGSAHPPTHPLPARLPCASSEFTES